MIVRILLLLSVILEFSPVKAQVQPAWIWADNAVSANSGSSVGYTTFFNTGKPAVVDGAGNMYVTGSHLKNTTFGNNTFTDSGFYLVKYTMAGTLAWAVSVLSGAVSTALAIDTAGNIVLTGNAWADTLTFGNYTITNPGGTTGGWSFVVKYSPSGAILSATAIGSRSRLYAIGFDSNGSMCLAGEYYSNNSVISGVQLPANNSTDIFVAKYDPFGTLQWVKTGTGNHQDRLRDMVVAKNGEVFITGETSDSFAIDTHKLYLPTSTNIFLAKFSTAGNVQWLTAATANVVPGSSGSSGAHPHYLTIDAVGNLYLSGRYSVGLLSFGNNVSVTNYTIWHTHSFLAKYNSAGIAQWARPVTGGTSVQCSNTIDASGNIYVSGRFHDDTAWLGNTYFVPQYNHGHGYIARYDPSGNLLNAFSVSGVGAPYSFIVNWIINSDGANGFYAAGSFGGGGMNFGTTTLVTTNYTPFFARYGVCTAPPAQPASISGPNASCTGKQLTFTASPVPDANAYTWTLPTGWTGTSTTNSINTTIGNSSGTVSVTADNLCGSSVPQLKTVSVSPTPNPIITQTGMTLSTAPGQGAYQWFWSNFPLAGATSNTYTVTMNGDYYVRVIGTGNCSDTSNTIQITQVSVHDLDKDKIQVYPQPNKGRFQVAFPDGLTPGQIKLTNIYGATVACNVTTHNSKVEIELTNKLPGVYFLGFMLEGKNYYRKIQVD